MVSRGLFREKKSQKDFGIRTHLQLRRVGTNNFANLFTSLEEDESRHGLDAALLRDLLLFVNVDLVELDLVSG